MTALVTLRPVTAEDRPWIQALASHPEVVATTRMPDPYPPDGAAIWLSWVQPRIAAGEEHAFAIEVSSLGSIGLCGLHDLDAAAGRAEAGYWLGRPYWGNGYASAAANALVSRAFGEIGLRSLAAHALADNLASRRVLEKAGFLLVGSAVSEVPKWPGRMVCRYRCDRA